MGGGAAGLPNKPSFSFGASTATGGGMIKQRAGMKMGGEEDEGSGKKIGMIKFGDEDLGVVGGGDGEEDDDDEDLEGGASYKGGAEAREKRMREIQEQEEKEGDTDMKVVESKSEVEDDVKMEVDTAKEETPIAEAEEEEEEDELDAFMSQVNKQVKNVEKEDKKKLNQNGGKKSGSDEVIMKNGEEPGGEEEEEVEEENTGMTAKDILAYVCDSIPPSNLVLDLIDISCLLVQTRSEERQERKRTQSSRSQKD